MKTGRYDDQGWEAPSGEEPLVSVVIPAFNATSTLPETLISVSNQTYRNLDIVVVDDGSTDDTAAIASAYTVRDPRVRLLQKENGGVASARNAGIRASKGELVAFIDADDLWHPTKIAKQMAVLLSGGPSMALVYAPFRLIDAEGKVLSSQRRVSVNGWVLYRHFHANLVGNGSSILVRKSVVEELGGFDPSLRAAGAEGCEDLLLQLRIAARYQFGEVPEYLIGYRRRPGSMSSDVEQMLRSGVLALRTALAECGHIPHLSQDAILIRYEWQRLRSAARRGRVGNGLLQFFRQFRRNPFLVMILLGDDLIVVASRALHAAVKGFKGQLGSSFAKSDVPTHFYEFDPESDIGRKRPVLMSLVLGRLARLDQTYRPHSTATRTSDPEARIPIERTASEARRIAAPNDI